MRMKVPRLHRHDGVSSNWKLVHGSDGQRLWIVDPLDGTRGFGEPDRDDWAVHVALVDGGRPVAGAVALPALGMTYATDRPPRAPAVPHRALRIAAWRTRPAQEAAGLARRLHGTRGWGLRGPRQRRSCPERATSTCTQAASTSGIQPHPSLWRSQPACMPRASMAPSSSMVGSRRGFPTSSCVEPSFAIESSKHYTTSGRQLRSE